MPKPGFRWGWALCALGALTLARGASRPATAQAPPPVPPLLLEDFESSTLGSRPYFWKEPKSNPQGATIGVERSALEGNDANKALKFEYAFPGSFDAGGRQSVEAGPAGQALPGSLSGLTFWAYGDDGKNALAFRLRDRQGEAFEWPLLVNWTGWKKLTVPLEIKNARPAGGKGNGQLDPPLAFEGVQVIRLQNGARKGAIMVDDVTAVCKFAQVVELYNSESAAKPEEWKANRNHATIGLLADNLVPRNGKDASALKMEYEYENGVDASVEFTRTLPAGDGHGTLILEVFGDGSNNILRFRMLDGAGHPWQATWANYLVDWSGWKTLYVDTRTLRDPGGQDPSAVMEKFPVKFYSLIVDDVSGNDALPGVESGRKGEIFLGRLLFASEK